MITSSLPAASDRSGPIAVRRIDIDDLKLALRAGLKDFAARPSHYIFLALVYPVAGIVIALLATNANAFPVLFPFVAGFALVGPMAALGFYEISRRAERGEAVTWADSFQVVRSPAFPAIVRVGLLLAAIFALWLISAAALFTLLLPEMNAPNYMVFVSGVLESPSGWTLIILGNLIGLAFAIVAFSLSVVALPLILDRHVGALQAMQTSIHAVRENPLPMAAWGVTIAALVFLGSLPLLVGLAVVIPVLGHASWHLYRRVVV